MLGNIMVTNNGNPTHGRGTVGSECFSMGLEGVLGRLVGLVVISLSIVWAVSCSDESESHQADVRMGDSTIPPESIESWDVFIKRFQSLDQRLGIEIHMSGMLHQLAEAHGKPGVCADIAEASYDAGSDLLDVRREVRDHIGFGTEVGLTDRDDEVFEYLKKTLAIEEEYYWSIHEIQLEMLAIGKQNLCWPKGAGS